MSATRYTLDIELHDELKGVVEDAIEYFCNEHMISGELAWLVTETLATAKLEQFKGNVH